MCACSYDRSVPAIAPPKAAKTVPVSIQRFLTSWLWKQTELCHQSKTIRNAPGFYNLTPYDALMIGALLMIPVQEITRRVSAALRQQGFTDYRPTYQVVFQWCRPEGSRLTELAERAAVTKQSMGEIIDALEQRGYVERIPDTTDGRATLIRRTERGWQVNRVAREVVEQLQQQWARELGEEAFTELLHHLRRLALLVEAPLGASGSTTATPPLKSKRNKAKEQHA